MKKAANRIRSTYAERIPLIIELYKALAPRVFNVCLEMAEINRRSIRGIPSFRFRDSAARSSLEIFSEARDEHGICLNFVDERDSPARTTGHDFRERAAASAAHCGGELRFR
jgi:hypothetical protein